MLHLQTTTDQEVTDIGTCDKSVVHLLEGNSTLKFYLSQSFLKQLTARQECPQINNPLFFFCHPFKLKIQTLPLNKLAGVQTRAVMAVH